MATTHRKPTAGTKRSAGKFEGLSDILSKLEVEAEKVVRRLIERTEQASGDLKRSVSDLLDQIRNQGIYSVATEKSEDLRGLVEEVVTRAKEIQFLPLGTFNRDAIVREARKNIEDVVSKLRTSDIYARAKLTALNTKDQVLSILSIPNHQEVVKLHRKITSLESRVNKLTRKAA